MKVLGVGHWGAIGDQVYAIPALAELRKHYVFLVGYLKWNKGITEEIFRNSGLFDKYIWRYPEMDTWTVDQEKAYLLEELMDVDMHDEGSTFINFRKVVPGVYIHHARWPSKEDPDPGFWWSYEKKRNMAFDVNFFEVFMEFAGLKPRKGARPFFVTDYGEREWLDGFKHRYGIPRDAFLLMWQWEGSSMIKQYPHVQDALLPVMEAHDDIYLIGLGDKRTQNVSWRGAGARFINFAGRLKWRQSMLLTSIADCYVGPETGITVAAQAFPRTPKILLATHTYGHHITCGSDTVVIQSEAKCSPCFNIVDDCIREGEHPWAMCVGKIPPERIAEEIEKVYERRRD